MALIPGVGWASPSVFQLGRGKTLAIPMEVHQLARQKVAKLFADKGHSSGVLLMKGGEDTTMYDTDTDVLFRQDSWFNYLFGVKEAGAYGAVSVATGKATLFMPKLDASYRIWCGEIHPPNHFRLSYGVDEVLFVDDLPTWLEQELSAGGGGAKLFLMKGTNSDSGLEAKPASFKGDATFADQTDLDAAYNIVAQCRVTKSDAEVEVMRYCAWVASNAHVAVMRMATKECHFEYELEAKFLYEIYRHGGCRRAAYNPICACGPNGATLHYGHAGAPNERELAATDMALLDMGAEYHGYVSDITCSFPLSGTFSSDQRIIYEGVLAAQNAVYAMMMPGTAWTDCHRAAEAEIIKALLVAGILQGGSVEELAATGMGAVFFPHGLGHLIGCDTHDVGGYIPGTPARLKEPGLTKLRTSRLLEVGMVLTNEPGCYFIDALLDAALADPTRAPYINADVLERFKKFGGVRIEDVVMVTPEGAENLTTCPRTVKEIETVLAGGQWPPVKDEAPELKRRWYKLALHGHGMVEDAI